MTGRQAPRRAVALLAVMVAAAGVVHALPRQDRNLETFDAAWNIINDTYWDPDFNGIDWQAVRDELRPQAAAAQSPGELRAVIDEMISRLGQSHFAVWPRSTLAALRAGDESVRAGGGDPGFETVLIDGRFVVARVQEDGPAAAAGVEPGWVVQRVDGEEVGTADLPDAESVESHTLAVAAQRGMDSRLSGVPGETLQLVMIDGNDEERDIDIQVARPRGRRTTFGNMPTLFARLDSRVLHPDLDLSVGLIGFNIWLPVLSRPFDEALDAMRDADGIILDLRGNPGGVGGMVMGIGGHFVSEPVALGTMRTRNDELRFVANPRRIDSHGESVEPYDGPLAILIDSTSASTSEVFAGGLQAIGRARIFGQRSMGAALPSMMDDLPNGDVLQHAIADFVVTETGVRLEGRGVVPDEEIHLSRAELLAGRDPTLDAAIEWIVGQR
ncbi:MAG: S41 family peptidase, partial [Acidobacteriota bacterium]|jgi:carboxyl-terminal processing protease